jgi:hypothetical protein
MRSKSNVPRSAIRQTLYPVIRTRRRRHLSSEQPEARARAEHAFYSEMPAGKTRVPK